MVQYLCELGADKGGRDVGEMTPLHYAAAYDYLAVVQYLCEQGADKETTDEYGSTQLHMTSSIGRLAVVQYFEGLK